MPVANTTAQNAEPIILSYPEFLIALQNRFATEENMRAAPSLYLEIFINNYPNMISWYNYAQANKVVEQLVPLLAAELEKGDLICRAHLDQIGILLHQYTNRESDKLIRRLREIIEYFENDLFRKPMHIAASFGCCTVPASGGTVEEMFHKAYIARCSDEGNSAHSYARFEDMETGLKSSHEDALIMHDAQQIMDENRLEAAYQPIVDSRTGQPAYYECLLRILNPGSAPTSAAGFIPMAEKLNFIKVVDRIMLQKVVEQLKANPALRLSFNISNATTDDAEWLKMCSKFLKNTDISSRVLVEITETAAHRDLRETAYFVASLQGLGCQVALDDFGVGYTSFRQLKALSVDIVKIDGTFIRDIVNNRNNQVFLQSIIDFAHNYGLKTVAEFVESGDVAKMLLDMDIDYLQGYYFGKPLMGSPWKEEGGK